MPHLPEALRRIHPEEMCIRDSKKSVASDRIVDVRLGLFVKVDNLCVASALEVEDTVVIPAMLVITDQETFRAVSYTHLYLWQPETKDWQDVIIWGF